MICQVEDLGQVQRLREPSIGAETGWCSVTLAFPNKDETGGQEQAPRVVVPSKGVCRESHLPSHGAEMPSRTAGLFVFKGEEFVEEGYLGTGPLACLQSSVGRARLPLEHSN